jgi:AraC-like DNA-binding protein
MSKQAIPASVDIDTPSVPVEFARLILQMSAERGYPREKMLNGLNITASQVDKDGAYLSIRQHMSLLLKGIKLSGDEGGLGYELGLRIGLSTHALVAMTLLSQTTIGDAIRLGIQFSQVFVPVYRGSLIKEDNFAVLDIRMDMAIPEKLNRYAYDMALVSVWSCLLNLFGGVWPDVELWFAYPEPNYFAAYRDRLPACRFDMGANQICFPNSQLERRIQTGDPIMAQLMREKIARELDARKQQGKADILTLLRPQLAHGTDGYPDMDTVCAKLFMSSRTLKRKLKQAGTGFQILLDDVRCQDAMHMLCHSSLSIEDIAIWMGFTEPANFTHAFKRWTNTTPSEWREQQRRSI